MTITYTWKIEQLEAKPQECEHQNVVVQAHWRCNASDGYATATAYGSCAMGPIQPEFTPYAQLTEQVALGWVWAAGVDKNAVEAALAQQIAAVLNPPVVTPPLPWAA